MSKSQKKKAPKRNWRSPTSELGRPQQPLVSQRQRTYTHAIDEFVGWYCSEPRLAFNRTVVLAVQFSVNSRLSEYLRALNPSEHASVMAGPQTPFSDCSLVR